jgi:hypothetical protein
MSQVMRFSPGVGFRDGEVRFRYERRTTNGVERVRLTEGFTGYSPSEPIRTQQQAAIAAVLRTVALPRRRVNTEATVEQIINALTFATGQGTWRLLNPTRVYRRRRPSVRRTYPAYRFVDSDSERRRSIHSYSYKPAPRFKVGGGETGMATAFYGIELEVDQRHDQDLDRSVVPDIAHPLFYCKEDGSLNNGVELVSHPGTAKWWAEQRGNVESILQRISRLGFRSHEVETCGMHVHISNTAFEGSMHIYRFLHLIYRFPTLALLVSQRNRRRLNQWATLRYSKKPQLKNKANIRLKRREWATADSAGHYDAVNKTDHTMELRIFNGTLNVSRFYKNLQFAEAAMRFTADTLNLRHVNAARFAAYVSENTALYPDLAAFLAEHPNHTALLNKRADKKAQGFQDAA